LLLSELEEACCNEECAFDVDVEVCPPLRRRDFSDDIEGTADASLVGIRLGLDEGMLGFVGDLENNGWHLLGENTRIVYQCIHSIKAS
jgi:hypothetical protein